MSSFDFPRSIDDYDIEVMTSAIPNKIGAMKSITVPYRITRRITTASLIKSLFEELTGYGGGNCVKNFNITIKGKCVICPNTAYARVVEKIANFILSLFYDCPSTITPSTPPTYTLPGGTQIYFTPTLGQSVGNNMPGANPTVLKIECDCGKIKQRINEVEGYLRTDDYPQGGTGTAYGTTDCREYASPVTWINPDLDPCIKECVTQHEDVHRQQCYILTYKNYGKDIKGQESPAYQTELSCLKSKYSAKCECADK